jgi:hypothetical protein
MVVLDMSLAENGDYISYDVDLISSGVEYDL